MFFVHESCMANLSWSLIGSWYGALGSWVVEIPWLAWLWHHHGRTHACVLSFAATACYQPLTCAWVHCSRLFSPLQRHTLMIYIISPRPKPVLRGPSPKPTLSLQASRAYRFQQSTSTLGSRAWHEARLWRQHDLIIEVLSMKFLWYQVSALRGPPEGDENCSFPSRVHMLPERTFQQSSSTLYSFKNVFVFFVFRSCMVLSPASHFGSWDEHKPLHVICIWIMNSGRHAYIQVEH